MKLLRDLLFVGASVVLAYFLVQSGTLHELLVSVRSVALWGPLLAGFFFTSAFTTPFAMVTLGEMSLSMPLLHVALVGALGSLAGDLALFFFLKDTFGRDLHEYLKRHPHRRIRKFFHLRLFRWLTPVLGALIIASPLPDELGLAMMGVARIKLRVLIPISLVLNFAGIVLIGLIANALV